MKIVSPGKFVMPTLACVAVLTAIVSLPADARQKKDDGLVAAGKPVSCIPINTIRNSRVRDNKTIDFETTGRKVYRNTLPYSCPGLGFEERFAFKTSINQLCSVDTITVLQTGGPGLMQGATCGLGEFQPMEKPKK